MSLQYGQLIESDFDRWLPLVVDYRGDVTFRLRSGEAQVGYVFSFEDGVVSMFAQGEQLSTQISLHEIASIHISGEDTAAGKSWEDWVAKKQAAKAQ